MKHRPWSLIASGAVFLWVLLYVSRGWWPGALPKCKFRELTGWDCPGCGGTRASLKLIEGDVWGAMRYHLPVVLLVLIGGIWLGTAVWRENRGGRTPEISGRAIVMLAILFVGFGIVRNLPYWPFTWFALP